MKAGMAQPALDGRGLVSAVIVQDQMQLQHTRHVSVDGFQKAAKLLRAIAPMKLANHGAPRLRDALEHARDGSARCSIVFNLAIDLVAEIAWLRSPDVARTIRLCASEVDLKNYLKSPRLSSGASFIITQLSRNLSRGAVST